MAPPLIQLKVRVPAELRRRLKIYAATVGKPMNTVIVETLETLLKKRGQV
jgi:predicted HicB family RNase H-like nuclease